MYCASMFTRQWTRHSQWVRRLTGSVACLGAACGPANLSGDGRADRVPGETAGPGGDAGGDADSAVVLPGGSEPDEQFPPELMGPYTGPAIDDYANTFIDYLQLQARVSAVFGDTRIGGNTETYFASKISLLGGADFKNTFIEDRAASTDFLLALDAVAKDACARAATNKTGPFSGTDPSKTGQDDLVVQLYQKMLFRGPGDTELADANKLVSDLVSLSPNAVSAWAGLCEVLVRHPDSLFTLPPSYATATGDNKARLRVVKFANDFAGRPPTASEFADLAGKPSADIVDYFATLPEFRDYLFHRLRVRTESNGTAESDEPARLWAYLVTTGAPLQDLFGGDYSVDEAFGKAPRDSVHGKTGILTMPGFIKTKPGLPHYNYAARVITDYFGVIFNVTPEIQQMRLDTTVASTVEKGSACYSCHSVLTPLAYQRARWFDDGTYHATDDAGAPIDDSDRGLVDAYRFKGEGMGAFAEQAVRKEAFLRTTMQAHVNMFYGRPMRYQEDERDLYKTMWVTAFDDGGKLLSIIKNIVAYPGYMGEAQ